VNRRPPPWQPWQLHRLRNELPAWNADVRRAIEAYDRDRQREADADERRVRQRRAYERRMRTRKREVLAELNARLSAVSGESR
jgi:RNA polymerase-binding transcription factor DksA